MSRQKTPYSGLRPKGINEAAWREIISSWEDGLSDREAAFRASRDSGIYITEAELKEIVATDDAVASLREFLQSDVISMAKKNIAGSIREGNITTSRWLLERKAPNEYSTKASVAFEGAVVGLTMEEKQAEMDKFLDDIGIGEKEEADGEGEV